MNSVFDQLLLGNFQISYIKQGPRLSITKVSLYKFKSFDTGYLVELPFLGILGARHICNYYFSNIIVV